MSSNADNALSISWHDSAWIPILNPDNVMDYFAERTNVFYDRTCNNETIRMQRLNPDQMQNMTGVEYILVHVQHPILYVIRKQHRHGPGDQVLPLQDYYIIAGIVYQAPDLSSVINSRLLNAIHGIQTAFDEARSFSRYHPSKAYWWEFKNQEHTEKEKTKEKKKKKEEPSSVFQRQQVDNLLEELSKKYPPRFPGSVHSDRSVVEIKTEPKIEVKTEKVEMHNNSSQASIKPPPEKKAKMIR